MNKEEKEKYGLTLQTEEAEAANITPFPLFFLKNQKRWRMGESGCSEQRKESQVDREWPIQAKREQRKRKTKTVI